MNNRLSIPEIAGLIAEYSGLEKKKAERFLKEFVILVRESVFNQENVKIKGLGTFKIIEVLPRESVDVNTGKRILIPGHYKFSFVPDKDMKEEVNKPFSFFETVEISDHIEVDAFEDPKEEKKEELQPAIVVEQSVPEIPVEEEPVIEETPIEEPGQPDEVIEEPPVPEAEVVTEEIVPEVVPEENGEEDMRPGFFIPKVENTFEKMEQPSPVESTGNNRLWWMVAVIAVMITGGAYFFFNRFPVHAWGKTDRDLIVAADSIADNLINEMFNEEETENLPESDDTIDLSEMAVPAEEAIQNSEEPGDKKEIIATVQIKAGNRLTLIALEYYGDKVFWVYLYEYNKEVIKDPNNVPIGTEIAVPAPEMYNINPNSKASIEKAALLQSQILLAF